MPSRHAPLYAATTTIAIVLVVGLLCFRKPAHAPVVAPETGAPSAKMPADASPTGGAVPLAERLDGKTWNMVSFTDTKGLRHDLSAVPFAFTFADRNLSGRICNTMRGPYRVEGNVLKGGPIMSTKMACAADLVMQIEAAFGSALESGLEASIGTQHPLFRDAAGNVYEFAPAA
jgi:heat shock protein HslJ